MNAIDLRAPYASHAFDCHFSTRHQIGDLGVCNALAKVIAGAKVPDEEDDDDGTDLECVVAG